MSISVRTAAATFATSTGANPTGTEPAGSTTNDILIALVVHNDKSVTLTKPTGWTVLAEGTSPSTGGASFYYWFGYIRRGSSAPSLVWTSGTSGYYEVHIGGLVGVDTTTAIDVQSASGTTATATTKPDPPATSSASTVANDASVTAGIHWTGSNGGWTAPTGYTRWSDNTNGNDAVMAYKLSIASGTTENPAAFGTGTLASGDLWNGYTVLFKTAGAGGTDGTVTAVIMDGTGDIPAPTVAADSTITSPFADGTGDIPAPTVTGANPPVNTVIPAITGTPNTSSTLTSDTGTWNNTPTSYAYQWQRRIA